MSALARRDIESSLSSKGFLLEEDRDHRFWYFYYEGKKTIIRTKISLGTSYKSYGYDLLKSMKRQLYLDTLQQLNDFIACPMSQKDYVNYLLKKGIIST